MRKLTPVAIAAVVCISLGAGARSEPDTASAFRAATEAARQIDYGGVHGAIGAAGAGVLRGGTLFLSDVVIRAVGGEDAELTLRGLREQNPELSVAGAVAGFLLLVFVVWRRFCSDTTGASRAGSERDAAWRRNLRK